MKIKRGEILLSQFNQLVLVYSYLSAQNYLRGGALVLGLILNLEAIIMTVTIYNRWLALFICNCTHSVKARKMSL